VATQSEILKFLIQGDAKSAIAAFGDLNVKLDGTETAGQRVAAQMKAMAQVIEASAGESEAAVESLSSALGAEFVASLERTGGSVRDVVARLETAGLTMSDIRADADVLAAALRDAGAAGERFGVDVAGGAARARTGLDEVHRSSDQSRSVLANMVGNSVQDLGALGGVAGTAGVALGQLGEYAADGNISIGGLARFAGPMLGVGAAVGLISIAMDASAKSAQRMKEEAQALLDVQTKLREGQFDEAAASLTKEYSGTITELQELGFTTEEVIAHITGQSSIMDRLGAILEANTVKFAEGGVGLTDYGAHINDVIGNLNSATTGFESQGDALTASSQMTKDVSAALSDYYDTQGLATEAVETAEEAEKRLADARAASAQKQADATAAAQERLQAERDLTTQLLSGIDADRAYEAAVDNSDAAIADLTETMADHESTLEDIDDAARKAQDTLISQAEAFARSKGAADGTTTAIQLQIAELYGLAGQMDPSSPLRARLIDYIEELQKIPPSVDTQLRLNITGATVTAGGDAIGYRDGARADGGPTAPRSLYSVVERGNPEVYEEGGNTYLLTGGSAGRVVALDRLQSGTAGRVASSIAGAGGSYSVETSGTGATAKTRADDAKNAADAKKAADDAIKEQDRVQAAMFETGAISLAEYRTYLAGRKASYEEYSEGYMAQWRLLRRLEQEEASAVAKQQADDKKAADDAKKAADDAKRAQDESTKSAYSAAEAARALTDATAKQQSASAEFDQASTAAYLYGVDKKRTPAERAAANDRVAKAATNVAQTAFDQAEATARAEGLAPGSVDYARRVREIVSGHITWNNANGRQSIGSQLEVLLSGVPQLASGAVVMPRAGGTLVNVGEAGRAEAVIPLDDPRAQGALAAGAGAGLAVHFHGPVAGQAAFRQIMLDAAAEQQWRRLVAG
jgi:hypothetical protein